MCLKESSETPHSAARRGRRGQEMEEECAFFRPGRPEPAPRSGIGGRGLGEVGAHPLEIKQMGPLFGRC